MPVDKERRITPVGSRGVITLGLGHDVIISSAALVRDGEVIAAVAEERLNRQKLYKGFPTEAVRWCLESTGTQVDDLTAIAVGWNPARHMEFANRRQSNNARWKAEYLSAVPNMLFGLAGGQSGETVVQELDGIGAPITYFDHQLCHAANGFYLSPFEECAVFTADGMGERATTSWGTGTRTTGLTTLGTVNLPNSLGMLYGSLTQYLGYKPDSDEWKVMAMASFGRSDSYLDRMRGLVQTHPGTCAFHVDQRYFSFTNPEVWGGRFFTPDLVELLGPPRAPGSEITQRHNDIAWALQRVFEETMRHLLTELHGITGLLDVALSGGCMMNSVYNGRVTSTTPFTRAFVSSCPDDSGIAVGAALLAYHRAATDAGATAKYPAHRHNYWGPSFDDEIEATLRRYKLPATRLDDVPRTAARMLADGQLIGWFQGGMEFGQRALGNRSILADPRPLATKDLVNAAVKYRESYRPFAPAILAERVDDWFDTTTEHEAPFMEKVLMFRDDVREKVQAVVHVDGSGRLQTVERDTNPRFHALIEEFDRLTGVPIVLNTSFNLNGEPIVCSPTDAIRTFASCGLDALILGDHLLTKAR
jgi:carbamoyltransferase